MAWVLTKGLTRCREVLNKRFPKRDKASDGSVGNLSHQQGTSGHNPDLTGKAEYKDGDSLDEVRAIDLDSDLNDPKYDAEALVQFWVVVLGRQLGILQKHVRYIIYKRRIWRAATGWKTETYTGASPHTEHIHVSGAYTQFADNDTTWTWGLDKLGEPEVALKDEQIAISASSAPMFKAGRKTASAAEFVALGAINAYRSSQSVATALAAIKQVGANDAQVAATLAAMQTLLQQIASSSGAFTPEQLEILKNTMKDSAAQAGAAATQRLEENLNSLREHLGDAIPA